MTPTITITLLSNIHPYNGIHTFPSSLFPKYTILIVYSWHDYEQLRAIIYVSHQTDDFRELNYFAYGANIAIKTCCVELWKLLFITRYLMEEIAYRCALVIGLFLGSVTRNAMWKVKLDKKKLVRDYNLVVEVCLGTFIRNGS